MRCVSITIIIFISYKRNLRHKEGKEPVHGHRDSHGEQDADPTVTPNPSEVAAVPHHHPDLACLAVTGTCAEATGPTGPCRPRGWFSGSSHCPSLSLHFLISNTRVVRKATSQGN